MEGDVLPVVQSLQLVAHVFEEGTVLLWVDLEAALEEAEDELDPADGDHAALVDVHHVPRVLEVSVEERGM